MKRGSSDSATKNGGESRYAPLPRPPGHSGSSSTGRTYTSTPVSNGSPSGLPLPPPLASQPQQQPQQLKHPPGAGMPSLPRPPVASLRGGLMEDGGDEREFMQQALLPPSPPPFAAPAGLRRPPSGVPSAEPIAAASAALPGRARRRQAGSSLTSLSNGQGAGSAADKARRRGKGRKGFIANVLAAVGWRAKQRKSVIPISPNPPTATAYDGVSFWSRYKIPLTVLLWYSLGVLSIGTSKVLLTDHSHLRDSPLYHVGGVGPLLLTAQQLFLGVMLLRFLIQTNFLQISTGGLQPMPRFSSVSPSPSRRNRSKRDDASPTNAGTGATDLVMCGMFFGLGFLATNYSFHGATASFVETIKAAEPITSAGTAILWGIETMGYDEGASLGVIVIGVLISTLGNSGSHDEAESVTGTAAQVAAGGHSLAENLRTCFVVMVANLCFSFRGLHQKLFRATPAGNPAVLDDVNLQYRMQQIGLMVFAVPALILDGPRCLRYIWSLANSDTGLLSSGVLMRYVALAILNGFAFTSYNLSSTYILTRISVVHHAALNCVRRVFAIVVTSIIFQVPITLLSGSGILISMVGFFAYQHYKLQRLRKPRPLSSLLPMSAV